MTTAEVGVVVIPLFPGAPQEIPIDDDAVGLAARVDEKRECVEIHYLTVERQPIPRRIAVVRVGAQVAGARHLISYVWLDQLWHVFMETDQE